MTIIAELNGTVKMDSEADPAPIYAIDSNGKTMAAGFQTHDGNGKYKVEWHDIDSNEYRRLTAKYSPYLKENHYGVFFYDLDAQLAEQKELDDTHESFLMGTGRM